MVEKNIIGISPDDVYEVMDIVAEHTRDCAYNIHFRQIHDNCRDCPCHHYRKM